MLIMKRSRKPGDSYRSRFRDGGGVDFPLRQYLRCRDDFFSGTVHFVVLAAFVVSLVFFGRTMNDLFDSHGGHLNPWFRRGAMLMLGLFVLLMARRLLLKFRYLRETRAEMLAMKAQLRTPPGDHQE